MAINFKQPRYILPLILLPFFCLFFYVFQGRAKPAPAKAQDKGIQDNVGEVAANVKKRSLTDKLDAFRNTYKESNGNTAVAPITNEQPAAQQRRFDSIDRAIKTRLMVRPEPKQDEQMTAALNALAARKRPQAAVAETSREKEKDPMQVFKQQMAYVDSMQKANDPALKAELEQQKAKAKQLAEQPVPLAVRKAPDGGMDFNTIKPETRSELIAAMVDEDVTAYAGSRVRLRLLEDIWAGKNLITKGSYLYGLVNGFTQQRVTLLVTSALSSGQILPVKLSVYDQDGLAGLYVPASAFRDFTKDLSGNTMQGVSISSGSTGSQLLMSSVDKVFQSTSSAIAGAIRKNKAKIKYGTQVFLIDLQTLQSIH